MTPTNRRVKWYLSAQGGDFTISADFLYPMITYHFYPRNHLFSLPSGIVPYTVSQRHTNQVHFVEAEHKAHVVADAMITTQSGIALTIRTADCLPIMIFDPKAQIIATVHAGWKGLLTHIIKHTVILMEEYGAQIGDLKVHIGPHIGACCYDIYGERLESFRRQFGSHPEIIRDEDPDFYLDLATCAQIQLTDLGVDPTSIQIVHECTSCTPYKYPSYHRDGRCMDDVVSTIWIDDVPPARVNP